ncbi:hypothetical protein ABT297_10115 [Dactylosporangium sp. NPDC000555]|uniref:hypothetical protein n=1 Tax=Dactylosporangium sp. NPDC000555 TaxID=3154260 RepID=UPI0033196962
MVNGVSGSVFWLTLALVNAGLAQTKNRSGWYWWVWSLLLGPIATALIVVWPPRPAGAKP